MVDVLLLGATGSIGTQVLDLIRLKTDYCLKAMSFGENIVKAREIIKEFKPSFVVCKKPSDEEILKKEFPYLRVESTDISLNKVVTYPGNNPLVINALVGSVGLIPTIEALKAKRNVLLANKETLVIGGEIVNRIALENQVSIIPIDSEHSAIFQLLEGKRKEDIKRLIITASGGPFLNKSKEELTNVTVEDAINHPNWKMGPKISVDCATLMNKGFEIIEAHYLFNLPMEKIVAIIHPESIIHSMVEFNDNSIFAQMASSDMHLPISYAINHPIHEKCDIIKPLDLQTRLSLHFLPLEIDKYPLVKLAYDVIKKGGIYPAVLNATNEVAVELFLKGKIKFIDIERTVINEYSNSEYEIINQGELTIDKIMMVDLQIKTKLRKAFGL